jgi:hypothetical protein
MTSRKVEQIDDIGKPVFDEGRKNFFQPTQIDNGF